MLKTALTGTILGIAVVTSSFASNGLNNILFANKHLSKPQNQSAVSINSKTTTTDFSGNWMGTCTDINESVSIEIDQSDESITLNGQYFIFGAMTTIASSNTISYDNEQMRFTWNPTRTILTLNAITTLTNNGEKNLNTIISETSFALDNDKLVMESNAVFYDNLESIHDKYKQTCSFTKTT